jgi:DNA-binding GntR family transcriptional regulator
MESTIFTRIEQRTVQQEVVDVIRQAIVSGKLEIGQHLAEAALSEQMEVSRIPIREALRQLEQEGLVTRYNNRGCFVTDFSDDDVREVFSLRSSLECMAIEWATPRITPEDITVLRGLIEEQSQAALAGDFSGLAQLDMRFHEYICIKAQHSRLLKEWYSLHAQCQILLNRRFQALSDYTPETVSEDHTHILDAFERGDIGAAIQLTKTISQRVELECIETLHHLKHKQGRG